MIYYHGTSVFLNVGDAILPPNNTKIIQEKGRKKNLDKVFFTTDLGSAKIYAGRAKNALGGVPRVYVVKPVGEVICLNGKKGTTVYLADAAVIVSVL